MDLIIYVYFIVLNEDIPILMSVKYMITGGLEISLIGRYVSPGKRKQALLLKNYFPTYRWTQRDLPYVMYTERELRTIHRPFGHPSIRATINSLKRADEEGRLDLDTQRCIEKIQAN